MPVKQKMQFNNPETMTKPVATMRKHRKTTKDKLVEAAAYLIHRRGYHGVGLTEILTLAKAPKGVLYHHFPGGKPELAVAAINLAAQIFDKQVREATAKARTPSAYVKILGKLTIDDLVATKFKAGCPLTTVALETAPDDAALSEACRQGFDLWIGTMTEDFTRLGVKNAAAKAELVLSTLEGALAIARTRKDTEVINSTAAMLAKQIG